MGYKRISLVGGNAWGHIFGSYGQTIPTIGSGEDGIHLSYNAFKNSGSETWYKANDDGKSSIISLRYGDIVFGTGAGAGVGPISRMKINEYGNVGIGCPPESGNKTHKE